MFKSSGASGGCLHGGASFKVERAHFAARKQGPENRKNEVKLRPPLCCPLKHSMSTFMRENGTICVLGVFPQPKVTVVS